MIIGDNVLLPSLGVMDTGEKREISLGCIHVLRGLGIRGSEDSS